MVELWFALFALYYVGVFLKEKYSNSTLKLKNAMQTMLVYFGALQVICGLIILFLPLSLVNGMIDFGSNLVTYLAGFYLVIELLVLVLGQRKLEESRYIHLIIIFFNPGLESPRFSIGYVYSYALLMAHCIKENQMNIEKEGGTDESVACATITS